MMARTPPWRRPSETRSRAIASSNSSAGAAWASSSAPRTSAGPTGRAQVPPSRPRRRQGGVERFLREARTASALNHPNICTIYDIGETRTRRQPFIVMELLEGRTLKHVIGGRPLESDRPARPRPSRSRTRSTPRTARASCIATSSPQTFSSRARPRQDSRLRPRQADIRPARTGRVPDVTAPTAIMVGDILTSPGSTLGTVAYMSPEQARGEGTRSRAPICFRSASSSTRWPRATRRSTARHRALSLTASSIARRSLRCA